MQTIHAKQALLPDGWASDITLTIDDRGRISAIDHFRDPHHEVAEHQVDILLPAPVNAHSHSFQRAFAGLTEAQGPSGKDSFWTWRQLIYKFLHHLTPEDVQTISAYVQMEMLEAGYATQVEFHYLHNQPDGSSYSDKAQMSHQIIAAAEASGIGLTLLPVLYRYSGCDKSPLRGEQLRFANDMDGFAKLWQGAAKNISNQADNRLGLAAHSLRAVGSADFAPLVELAAGAPIHLHLAEQEAETEEVEKFYGQRPVSWALDHLPLSDQFTLIHCTQISNQETLALARSGAIVGLCPITEANLGDGIFPAKTFLNDGGKIAIGSDSNILISLAEELRLLEYGQRLILKARAVLAEKSRSTGRYLFDAICHGGAKAAGRQCGVIATGAWADLFCLKGDHPDLVQREGDNILDSFIFAKADQAIDKLWSAGRLMVLDGRHIHHEALTSQYKKSISALLQKI